MSLSESMRERQREWARRIGLDPRMLDDRWERSWVLRAEHREWNVYRREWWEYVRHHEHRWSRALTSSQCFAVNVFAPLKEDRGLARAVWARLRPRRPLGPTDTVTVEFEWTPPEGLGFLGERGQPTQVDVALHLARGGSTVGILLVEVKLTETAFGSCRGFSRRAGPGRSNPDRSRCLDLRSVYADPSRRCWLVESEGRRYWDLIADPQSSFSASRLLSEEACPFRGGTANPGRA